MTLRFVCDHNVDTDVRRMLARAGHQAWTALEAGQATVGDDELTIYADDHNAVVVTHDHEFSTRRMKDIVGRHLWLKCDPLEAADVLSRFLDEVVGLFDRPHPAWISVTVSGINYKRG